MTDEYALLAQFYDAVHQELAEDIAFVLGMAQHQSGRVLELGCGTGRLIAPLLDGGLNVVGVDNSAEMLTIAQQNVPAATLVQADMTTLALPQRDFAFVLLSHNTVHHLPEPQLKATLNAIAQHLAPDGLVLIDSANPLLIEWIEDEPNWVEERQFAHPSTGEPVRQFARWRVDGVAQQMIVQWEYRLAGSEVVSAETTYHYHKPDRFQALCKAAGLSWHTIYGNYDFADYDAESERLLIVLRKANS